MQVVTVQGYMRIYWDLARSIDMAGVSEVVGGKHSAIIPAMFLQAAVAGVGVFAVFHGKMTCRSWH